MAIKKKIKEDLSEEFEKYMIEEWLWIKVDSWIQENSKAAYRSLEDIHDWFRKYNSRNTHH